METLPCLQEVELICLSGDIPHTSYSKLCNALGYSYDWCQTTLANHRGNYIEAMTEILIKWNTERAEKSQSRSILATTLHTVNLGGLGTKLSKGEFLPRHQEPHEQQATPLQGSSGECVPSQQEPHEQEATPLQSVTGEYVPSQQEPHGQETTPLQSIPGKYVPSQQEPHGQEATPLQSVTGEYLPKRQDPHEQEATPLQSIPDEYLPRHQEPHGQEATPLQSITGEYVPSQQEPHGQETTPLQSIPESIYLEKISESMTVQQCREKLESRYLNQLCKIQMKPWDHTDYAEFEDMHTVVTMLKKDARGKDTTKNEILQGSVGEIFSTKVNGKLPNRILISAPAGRGKTTAVAKIAYDWAKRKRGSALNHLPLLFVVKFRNTSQLTSIGEAIKSQLLSDVDDLTPEGLESFIRKNQGICHIIIDGLDEYAGIFSSIRSFMSNIVSVIRWEEFPQCRVLVTTRPHLENFFDQDELPRVYTKMWIEGFSRESSREYIDKFFASNSSPDSGRGLKVYLDNQPLITELVKTPLFCLMICHLWGEGLLYRDITTQTELLDSVNVFLMHHANTRSKPRVKITSKELRTIISQLGEVALTGLLDDATKLVFTPHDFRKVPAILDRACELGIVSKTTVYITCLPQSKETTSTTIEFYHKLAQEHSAGKYLADHTYHSLLRLKISKLDRVLRKIRANIGDYENLIRFTAGSDNSLCIRIMEALLANSRLNESERYRIILDCSSETKSTEENVSSLVQRCVNAQCVVLKAPTVYTVVGMQNLPKQLKREVKTVRFEGSTLNTDVTSGLWSCLKSFPMLRTLTISDSSLGFPSSPPELPSVTKLSAERVTSQSYEGVLSSVPGVREIDVSIDVTEASNTHNISTTSRPMSQIRARDEKFFVHVRLHAWPLLTTHGEIDSGETNGGLSLLFGDQTRNQQRLHVSGVKGRDEEALVDLFVRTQQLTSLNSESGSGSLSDTDAAQNAMLKIQQCQLSTEMTEKLWSYLRSFTSLNQLSISDSSLSFPTSPPELQSITKLSAERVTSQSYEGLLSSLPGLKEVDITIGEANAEDISQIRTSLRRYMTGQELTCNNPHFSTSEGNVSSMSRMRMRGLGLLITESQAILSGVAVGCKETVIDFVQSSTRLMSGSLYEEQFYRLLNSDQDALHIDMWSIKDCQLSTKMIVNLWVCLRSITSLHHLTISDSSLSFPPFPPEFPYVTKLSVKRMTSQSYEGLLSSVPGLIDIDITIDDAERDIFHITAGLRRTRGRQLTRINLIAPLSLPSEKNRVSRETMRGFGIIIKNKNLQRLDLTGVKCTYEEDLVFIIECCRRVTKMSVVRLDYCGNEERGRLESYLRYLHKSSHGDLYVRLCSDGSSIKYEWYSISHTY